MVLEKIAVYTTIYPGVEPFLSEWYTTVQEQIDNHFDLWIGVDGLELSKIKQLVGKHIETNWVLATQGATPAQVRQQVLEHLVNEYEALVFVDSDDLLLPTRVAEARYALRDSDVNGCALNLVNKQGTALNVVFRPRDLITAVSNMPRTNVFGLSNTAYRTEMMKQCLPIPPECVLVDWFLATMAWGMEARFSFDFVPRMYYRQHENNIAGFLPPFTARRVQLATKRVLGHYDCVLRRASVVSAARYEEIKIAAERVQIFFSAIAADNLMLTRYTDALNEMACETVWWAFVAHPELEWLWKN